MPAWLVDVFAVMGVFSFVNILSLCRAVEKIEAVTVQTQIRVNQHIDWHERNLTLIADRQREIYEHLGLQD